MKPITLDDASRVLCAAPMDLHGRTFCSVCTDTREGTRDALFFALHGDRSDGHSFVASAEIGGAAGAVVEREVPGIAMPQLLVANTYTALGQLAAYYRSLFTPRVVGITGSVGKTSVKNMLGTILQLTMPTVVSQRNHNNEIGVPKTLFAIEDQHKAAVVEMGMRGLGQITYLGSIAKPWAGVITNIGVSHIELLGSRDAIAEAKAELLHELPPDGAAVLPFDDDYFPVLYHHAPSSTITFGTRSGADLQVTDIQLVDSGNTEFCINGHQFRMASPGAHLAINAAAACAAATLFGIGPDVCAVALAHYKPSAMRMEVKERADGLTVLNDTYNAAPDSMASGLTTLVSMANGRHARAVAILGDMRELGAHSANAHRQVGKHPAMRKVSLLITVGDNAATIGEAASKTVGHHIHMDDTASAVDAVAALLRPDDVVLVKGSRALELERVVQAILGEEPDAQA